MNLTQERRMELRNLWEHYGHDERYLETIKTLSELKIAMLSGTEEEVIARIADLEIMLEQLKDGLNIRAKVCGEISYKLKRELAKIGKAESTISIFNTKKEQEAYNKLP